MAQIPEKLNDFLVYFNGAKLAGTADIQLPAFENLTETVRGAGILGEYESPTIGHFQSMKMTINWRVVNESVISLVAPVVGSFDCRGANQIYDSGTGQYIFVPCRVLARGIANRNELGKMEKGSPYDASSEIEITYIKVEINGVTRVELDKVGYKFVVNGKDYLADIRKALGM